MAPSAQSSPSQLSERQSAFFSQRSRRQLGLFAAGAGFLALSTVVTRRSLVRKYKATLPKFYQPSNYSNPNINGGLEAVEALSLATLNVFSVSMMFSGGLLWAFDISSLDEMRRKVRSKMGAEGSVEDKAAEEEIEEWFATVLSRKEFKHLKGGVDLKKPAEKSEVDEKKP